MNRIVTASVVALGVLALAGCGKKEEGAAKPAAVISLEARETFKQRCTVCHGETGKGDGIGAAALNPKPRAYSDKAWQASVTDEHLKKVIVGGGAAVGKSALMPPNPDLASKPEVVDGLVGIVREFGSK